MNKLYHWINSLNHAFWTRVVRATRPDTRSLPVFRIIAGVGLLLFYFPTFSWIGESPRALFNPPVLSIANVVGTFPGSVFFIALDLLLLLSIVCIIIGVKARMATLVYVVASLTGFSFQYSFGKIDHYILPYVLLTCLSFSGWGSYLAALPDKHVSKAAAERSLSLSAVLICFAFFTAGFEKALHWIDFDLNTNGFAMWFYEGYYNLNRKFLLAPFFKHIPFQWLEFFDYAGVVFELTPLFFLLWSRKAWLSWLLLASVFHLVNTLLLNIPFVAHFVVFLAFVDFSAFFDRVKKASQKRAYQILLFSGILFLVLFRLHIIFNYRLSTTIFVQDYLLEANLYLGAAVWTIMIAVLATSIIRKNVVEKNDNPAAFSSPVKQMIYH